MASRLGEVGQLPFDFHTRSTSTWSLEKGHSGCMLFISVTNEGTAKEELCIKCFNANQAINTQAQKDDLEKEQQQQQPSV